MLARSGTASLAMAILNTIHLDSVRKPMPLFTPIVISVHARSMVLALLALCGPVAAQDMRAYQHGIDILPLPTGGYVSIWASEPAERLRLGPVGGEDWQHNVYAGFLSFSTDSASKPLSGRKSMQMAPYKVHFSPQLLLAAPNATAQEPASSAITADGHIMVTMEDAYQAEHTLMQSYAIFDTRLQPVAPYQQMVFDGGHSGHVAAVGNRFVVFYSEGWITGGGVDNLGTGDDVWLSTFSSTGKPLTRKAVVVGDDTRDWWPVLAGSPDVALLIWQRFIAGTSRARLMYALYHPLTNMMVTSPKALRDDLQYYTYDVQYLAAARQFLITGTTRQQTGFAYLMDERGKVTASNTSLPPFVREAQPAISSERHGGNNGSIRERVVYPVSPSGLMVLSIAPNDVRLAQMIEHDYLWGYAGTDGVFVDNHYLYFQTLSPNGLQQLQVTITDE
ncbi:hypothetical protein HNR62_003072 [Oceanisphaera litoralis]|uniref:hypothetical protein n=1 Tax=Oceanisphaera litoralis TaxID=225144 RepID=UPI00195D2E6A|nr:hypothetical protein [Oceanisphaera litoralis]MBM7457160.1 hypothetical protein [Oceanisphaera litoralis]